MYFVPAFAGLFAPYWRSDARGIMCGMTAFNNKAHVVRAALESTAFQTYKVLSDFCFQFMCNRLCIGIGSGGYVP